MPYESTITFTLDTICPWTYLALTRLRSALSQFTSPSVTFTLLFSPFQLYPTMSTSGHDKYTWYLSEKYNSSSELMTKYTTVMTHLGSQATPPIPFDFTGTIANTLQAHRLIQLYQKRYGPEVAGRFVDALYALYFCERAHPSSRETLLEASLRAGVDGMEAEGFVGDEEVGLREVERLVGEEEGNGVDSVPIVVVEGRKRDFTLQGAKSVEEYVKCLEQVAKECA